MQRRTMIKLTGAAVVGAAVSQVGCEKQDVDFYVNTITMSLGKLKPLLPNQAQLLSKAISIANEVNKAYQDGKFDSALLLLSNLISTINEVVAAAGVNLTDSAKIILAIADVALTAVIVLIKGSIPASDVAREVSPAAEKIKSLGSSKRVDAIFAATRP